MKQEGGGSLEYNVLCGCVIRYSFKKHEICMIEQRC